MNLRYLPATLCFALLWIMGACASAPRTTRSVANSLTFAEIRIAGGRVITERDLLTDDDHSIGNGHRGITADAVERAARRANSLLLERGYVTGSVNVRRSGGTAIFVVNEGPQFRVGSSTFTAVCPSDEVAVASLQSEITRVLPKGAIFNLRLLVDALEKQRHALQEDGYANANIDFTPTIHAADKRVDVDFSVERGAIVTVERVDIDPRLLPAKLAILVHAGDRFRQSAISRSIEALRAGGSTADGIVEKDASQDRVVVAFRPAVATSFPPPLPALPAPSAHKRTRTQCSPGQ